MKGISMHQGYNWRTRVCASLIAVILFVDLFFIHAIGALQRILYVTIIVLLVFMIWSPEAREAHEQFNESASRQD